MLSKFFVYKRLGVGAYLLEQRDSALLHRLHVRSIHIYIYIFVYHVTRSRIFIKSQFPGKRLFVPER
jgi:hypothetical protein